MAERKGGKHRGFEASAASRVRKATSVLPSPTMKSSAVQPTVVTCSVFTFTTCSPRLDGDMSLATQKEPAGEVTAAIASDTTPVSWTLGPEPATTVPYVFP